MSLKAARYRAQIYSKIRAFFGQREVHEVETPLLSSYSCIDDNIDPVVTEGVHGHESGSLYLQTSPELYMKQLLTREYPSIFQISKSFRRGEAGKKHNPEFTLLEWYRLDFDDKQLIAETADLFRTLVAHMPTKIRSYSDVFKEITSLDPVEASVQDCQDYIRDSGATTDFTGKNELLIYIMSEFVEPRLPRDTLNFIRLFPSEQCALAELNPDDPSTSLRFELYVNGVELCNGYRELTDAAEYKNRFETINKKRQSQGLTPLPVNEPFLQSLKKGLPPCSGAALGLDRLLMLGLDTTDINDVLEFPMGD